MPSRLLAALLLALALAVPASGAVSDMAPTPATAIPSAPTGLRGFLLRSNEAVSNSFPRTPSFVWSPVKGTLGYEFQLATSSNFDESMIVWASSAISTPYTSLPISLPWMTGGPPINGVPSYALYARVRAITQVGTTEWSNPFGFDMRGSTPVATDPQYPGLVHWTPVDGATSYDVWFQDQENWRLSKTISTISNVADEREWYTFLRAPSPWDNIVRWRVRAVRRLFGLPLANGLPPVSYGPWSPVNSNALAPVVNGTLGPIAAVSDKVTPDGTTNPHSIVPGYTFTPGFDHGLNLGSLTQPLYRVVVSTDNQCVNVVFRGSIVGGMAYAPRITGPLDLSKATGLTVTLNQATNQSDPTNSPTIDFTVVFSDTTNDFATGDVALTGTAGADTATVTGSGTTYNVEVSGMVGPGTVIATIPAGSAHDANGNGNGPSTGTDNTVTFDPGVTLVGPGGPTGVTGATGPMILPDGSQASTYGADISPVIDGEEVGSAASPAGTTGPTGPTGASGPTGLTGTTSLPSDFATLGAPVDLWDNSSGTAITSQTGRYYWTVVPVGLVTLINSGTQVYTELKSPQQECEAGHVSTFSKFGTPVTSFDSLPYVTGLAPDGTIATVSVADPTLYGPPLAAWEPMSGATGYEVQWSKTLEPWKTEGTPILTPSTSTLIAGLTPGAWYYRVRGLDPFLPGPFQRTAWSRPIHVNVAPSTFLVTAAKPAAPKTKPVVQKAKPATAKVPKAKIPQGFASFKGWANDFTLALPKTWHPVSRTSPLVQNSLKQGGFTLRFVAFDPKSKGGYATNLTVLKGPGRGSTPFADWTGAVLNGIKSSLASATTAVAYHVAGLPAGKALEVEYPVVQGTHTLWLIQYLVDAGSTSYALTFATLKGHEAGYRAKFVAAARSFRIR